MRPITKYFKRGSSTITSNSKASSTNRKNQSNAIERQARYLAEQICSGFQLHDRRQKEESIEAFHVVDKAQFAHLEDSLTLEASRAFADALWAKDDIEKSYLDGGAIDPEAIRDADYTPVLEAMERRAEAAGIDRQYAVKTTEAWRKHKTGEEYWTDFLEAQTHELRVALQHPDYPDKPKEGRSGYGPLPMRYVLAVELHDQHTSETWEEAIRVMVPYYRQILLTQQREPTDSGR